MTEVLKINSHEELIATIPHTLGFQPVESMVCLAIGDGPAARIDLPTAPEDMKPFLKALTSVYLHAHHPTRVVLVAFGDDGVRATRALGALREALSEGPEVGPVLWVKGEQWTELLTGTRGSVSASARARIDAEYSVRGRVMPAGSREALAAAMMGDPGPIAAHLPHTWERFRGLADSAVEGEVDWVAARIEGFLVDQRSPSELDAARMLVALTDSEIRDAVALATRRVDAPVLSGLWQDLTRRAPAEVRDAPATLLGLSSWLEGQGAKAWTALDQLSEPNRLGDLVTNALEEPRHPRTWDRAVPEITGVVMQQAALREQPTPIRTQARKPSVDPDTPGTSPGR